MKRLATLLLFASVLFASIARETAAKVSYRQTDDIEINGILDVVNALQMTVYIHSEESDARFYELWLVQNTKGVENRELFTFIPIKPDSTIICVTAMAVDSTSVRVSLYPHGGANRTIKMPTAQCILMECTQSSSDTIPVIGYTPGVHVCVKVGEDKYADAYNYCALRDANVHPSRWGKQFDIEDYFYLEAIPVKEVDFMKALPK